MVEVCLLQKWQQEVRRLELLLLNLLVSLVHNLHLEPFHVGGTASRSAVDSSITIKKDGKIEIEDLKTVKSKMKMVKAM